MGRIRALVALVFGAFLLAPTAAIANEVRVGVEPSTAAPGDAVTVLSTCGGGTTSSDVFGTSELVSLSRDDRYTSGASVAVEDDAREGAYEVEVTCRDGRSGSAELVVSGSGVKAGGGSAAGGVDRTLVGVGVLLLAGAGLGFAASRRRAAG